MNGEQHLLINPWCRRLDVQAKKASSFLFDVSRTDTVFSSTNNKYGVISTTVCSAT
jgi:hypothetical protein